MICPGGCTPRGDDLSQVTEVTTRGGLRRSVYGSQYKLVYRPVEHRVSVTVYITG